MQDEFHAGREIECLLGGSGTKDAMMLGPPIYVPSDRQSAGLPTTVWRGVASLAFLYWLGYLKDTENRNLGPSLYPAETAGKDGQLIVLLQQPKALDL